MEELLSKITLTVSEYRDLGDKLVFEDIQVLNGLLKNLSGDLFFLEKYRDDYARKYNSLMYGFTKDGSSVSGAEIKAKEQVPELYMLRRIMTAGYKCQDAIRTNISYLKTEKE